jgi:broad specificity phosphatase PhoE
MNLYFVRHGESEANLLHEFSNRGWKHGLTEKGISQARELAEELSVKCPQKIYSSPLMRAVQTAELLASRWRIDFEITDSLREFDTGINEGRSDVEGWQQWEIVMDNWNRLKLYESRISQGECFNDMRRRFIPFIERVCLENTDPAASLVFVGHGALYYCMLPLLLNLDTRLVASLPFPNTGYVLAESIPSGLICREWCGKGINIL